MTDTDVVIVGGGLGGCLAAKLIADLGYRVRVVDRVADPPHEFRAEQIVGAQVERLRALGVLDAMARRSVRSGLTFNARNGVILDRTRVDQYGIAYRDMVLGARSVLPENCLQVARVTSIETAPRVQTIRLADGGTITARLVVVATGLLPQMFGALGMDWAMVSESHSLCIGFDVSIDPSSGPVQVPLTYYGERVKDRLDYLALFRLGGSVRANLFVYHPRNSSWVRDFVAAPDAALRVMMPGLDAVVGRTKVASSLVVRSNDIKVATNVRREGIVVIGDAYQTPCPAAGTGIDRILSDIDALSRHLPAWMAGNAIAAGQIAKFYDDQRKQAFDLECIRIARYRRAVSTETGLRWALHRRRVAVQRYVGRVTGPRTLDSVYGRLGECAGRAGLAASQELSTGVS